MLLKYWIWKLDPGNIYIFSKTSQLDLTYRPYIRWRKKKGVGLNMYSSVDMQIIEDIIEQQKKIKQLNMACDKHSRQELKRILIIYDDVIGDEQLKSDKSQLSTFSCMSRHSCITNIFLTQNYTSIPSIIRRQTQLVFLMNMDNYSEIMAEENSL